jgi:hypothetical protein
VADYVEMMVKFRTRILQAKHRRELAAVREEVDLKATALRTRSIPTDRD